MTKEDFIAMNREYYQFDMSDMEFSRMVAGVRFIMSHEYTMGRKSFSEALKSIKQITTKKNTWIAQQSQ